MSSMLEDIKLANSSVPRHVAIIMDGNGRWAEQRGKMRIFGHRNAIKAVRDSVRFAASHGIERLTLFAFSSENWRRPLDEVSGLMDLFSWALTHELRSLCSNNVSLRVLGDISRFSTGLQDVIRHAEQSTSMNKGLVLNVAVNYGGRWDILNASKKLMKAAMEGQIDPDKLTEDDLTAALDEQQDVDLLIRTGGEKRISNFLLWQMAYGEMYFSDVLWPDFNEECFNSAIQYYAGRQRRFGCTGKQITSSMTSEK